MSSEKSLSYNGPLSTYREWHATLLGALVGAVLGWSQTARRDIRREPQYAVAGFLAAALVAFALTR